MILSGDRYEMFVAAQAAMLLGIPIGHIHGGEVTEGAFDNQIRHAITKMAHVHFPVSEVYARRIIQLGEPSDRVFTISTPSLDILGELGMIPKATLEKSLDVDLASDFFILTYHPVTLTKSNPDAGLNALADALGYFPDVDIIVTGVNADPDSRIIRERINNFVAKTGSRIRSFESLGHRQYLSIMKYCKAVIGNSSSGIIEAPAIGVPTINIGERQKGRVRAPSIIDCCEEIKDIKAAIDLALSPMFQKRIKDQNCPYKPGAAAIQVLNILLELDFEELKFKRFVDIVGL